MSNAPRVPVPPSKPLPTSARCLWLHVRLPPPVVVSSCSFPIWSVCIWIPWSKPRICLDRRVSPKKSYLSEYSSRVSHTQTTQLLAAWHDQVNPMGLFDGTSF